MKKRNTLQRRLLLYFLLISLLPATLFSAYYLMFSQRKEARQLQTNQQTLLIHAMDKIENRITQVNEFVSWTLQEGDFSHLPAAMVSSSEIGDLDRRIQDMGDNIERPLRQQNKRQKLELHLLQVQMNPHFLYNTLSSIGCRQWRRNKRGYSPLAAECPASLG